MPIAYFPKRNPPADPDRKIEKTVNFFLRPSAPRLGCEFVPLLFDTGLGPVHHHFGTNFFCPDCGSFRILRG